MPTDVNVLLEESKCFECLTPGQMAYIETAAMDTWAINEASLTPAAVPEFVIDSLRWYDAGSFTGLADGATIAVSNPWVDKSPNQSNISSVPTKEPFYKTNVFGSRPAVSFPGVYGMAFDSGAIALDDFTILAVVKAASDSIWMVRITVNRQVRILQLGENILSLAFPGVVKSAALLTPPTAAKMIGYRRVASTGAIDFFENDAVLGADGTNTSTFHLLQIGVTDGGSQNIDIGEVVIYDSAVSTEDISELYNTYFKPKYGLP